MADCSDRCGGALLFGRGLDVRLDMALPARGANVQVRVTSKPNRLTCRGSCRNRLICLCDGHRLIGLFWRDCPFRACRQWRKRRQERRERKRARHEARRARQGDVLLEDVQDEDGKRLEQLEEGGEEGEEEGQEREEGVLESGWGPTAMDEDADDGYGDGDREREGSALSRDGDGGESGRLGDSTKTGPDRW